jgi:hypothetical protein
MNCCGANDFLLQYLRICLKVQYLLTLVVQVNAPLLRWQKEKGQYHDEERFFELIRFEVPQLPQY